MEPPPRLWYDARQDMYPWYQPTRGGSVMTFKEVLAHVTDWLQQDQRISYRALKR